MSDAKFDGLPMNQGELTQFINDLDKGNVDGLSPIEMNAFDPEDIENNKTWVAAADMSDGAQARSANHIRHEANAILGGNADFVTKIPEGGETFDPSDTGAEPVEVNNENPEGIESQETDIETIEDNKDFFASEEQYLLHKAAINIASAELAKFENDEDVVLADTSVPREEMESHEWSLTDNENNLRGAEIIVDYGKAYGMDHEGLYLFFQDKEQDIAKSIVLTNVGSPDLVPNPQDSSDISEIIDYINSPYSNLIVEWVTWYKISDREAESDGLTLENLEDGSMDEAELQEKIAELEEKMSS